MHVSGKKCLIDTVLFHVVYLWKLTLETALLGLNNLCGDKLSRKNSIEKKRASNYIQGGRGGERQMSKV